LKGQSGNFAKTWHFLGIPVWKVSRSLTAAEIVKELEPKLLERDSGVKKELLKEAGEILNIELKKLLLDMKKELKTEILTEINQGLDKIFNPVVRKRNA
jgi:hypothetical protein